jgi:hypothetical protein
MSAVPALIYQNPKQENKVDGLVKIPTNLSFRAKREIFRLPRIKNRRFLPVVEMTDSLNTAFYEAIKVDNRRSS